MRVEISGTNTLRQEGATLGAPSARVPRRNMRDRMARHGASSHNQPRRAWTDRAGTLMSSGWDLVVSHLLFPFRGHAKRAAEDSD
jgi:hypothetical protein